MRCTHNELCNSQFSLLYFQSQLVDKLQVFGTGISLAVPLFCFQKSKYEKYEKRELNTKQRTGCTPHFNLFNDGHTLGVRFPETKLAFSYFRCCQIQCIHMNCLDDIIFSEWLSLCLKIKVYLLSGKDMNKFLQINRCASFNHSSIFYRYVFLCTTIILSPKIKTRHKNH